MTNEMLQIILKVALTKLMGVPPTTLTSYAPWLTREHILFCLAHVAELRLLSDEDTEARQWIREAAELLRREQGGTEGGRSDDPTH